MKGPPILNKRLGGPDWGPIQFVGLVNGGNRVKCDGMARRLFAVFCLEANGLPPEPKPDGAVWPIIIAHLPTGMRVAEARHGAQGYRIGDALLDIEEFGLPLDVAALEGRAEDIARLINENGGLF